MVFFIRHFYLFSFYIFLYFNHIVNHTGTCFYELDFSLFYVTCLNKVLYCKFLAIYKCIVLLLFDRFIAALTSLERKTGSGCKGGG